MNFFTKEEQNKLMKEFENRNGIYTRLYNQNSLNDKTNGFGNPIGLVFRCESKNKDYITILRYTFPKEKYSKQDFENFKFIGLDMALKKADRYIKFCKEKNETIAKIEYIDDIFCDRYESNKSKAMNEYILNNFTKRMYRYYKHDLKIMYFWY